MIKLGFLGAMIWAGSIVLGKGVDLVRSEGIRGKEEVKAKEGTEEVKGKEE